MRKIQLTVFFILFVFILSAQQSIQELKKINSRKFKNIDTSGWHNTGFFIFNLNQAALSDWSSGGERFLIGINGILNYALHHKMGKFSFDSYFDLELGAVEASSFKKFRKTTDRFDLTMEMDHSTSNKNLFYGLLFNINTQLLGGHNYALAGHDKVSGFLSPGKFLLAPGIDFKSQKQESYFSIFISPGTFRWVTKIEDDFFLQSKFGVDSSHKINLEFGAYITSHYNVKISKTTRYIGRVDLFSNYFRKPENIDVLMNNLLTINISNLFSANLLFDLVYDHDTKRRTQIQEIFGLGLKLKL